MPLSIPGARVSLRPLRLSDADDIYRHVNDPEVARWTELIPYPYPPEKASAFVRFSRYRLKKNKAYILGIVPREPDCVIGIIELAQIQKAHMNATLGYWLGRDYWNRGLMTEAVNLILSFGFQELGLHRISADVFPQNPASKRVLEKCGFKLEGTSREERFKFAEWQDLMRYGVLAHEWMAAFPDPKGAGPEA